MFSNFTWKNNFCFRKWCPFLYGPALIILTSVMTLVMALIMLDLLSLLLGEIDINNTKDVKKEINQDLMSIEYH